MNEERNILYPPQIVVDMWKAGLYIEAKHTLGGKATKYHPYDVLGVGEVVDNPCFFPESWLITASEYEAIKARKGVEVICRKTDCRAGIDCAHCDHNEYVPDEEYEKHAHDYKDDQMFLAEPKRRSQTFNILNCEITIYEDEDGVPQIKCVDKGFKYRGAGTLFGAKNGINIRSIALPKILGSNIFILGHDTSDFHKPTWGPKPYETYIEAMTECEAYFDAEVDWSAKDKNGLYYAKQGLPVLVRDDDTEEWLEATFMAYDVHDDGNFYIRRQDKLLMWYNQCKPAFDRKQGEEWGVKYKPVGEE